MLLIVNQYYSAGSLSPVTLSRGTTLPALPLKVRDQASYTRSATLMAYRERLGLPIGVRLTTTDIVVTGSPNVPPSPPLPAGFQVASTPLFVAPDVKAAKAIALSLGN